MISWPLLPLWHCCTTSPLIGFHFYTFSLVREHVESLSLVTILGGSLLVELEWFSWLGTLETGHLLAKDDAGPSGSRMPRERRKVFYHKKLEKWKKRPKAFRVVTGERCKANGGKLFSCDWHSRSTIAGLPSESWCLKGQRSWTTFFSFSKPWEFLALLLWLQIKRHFTSYGWQSSFLVRDNGYEQDCICRHRNGIWNTRDPWTIK